MDEFLDGSAHCHELEVRLRHSVGILAKTKYYINKNELISLCHATFSSLLLYGCQVWNHGNLNHIRKIEVLQNSAIQIISNDYEGWGGR